MTIKLLDKTQLSLLNKRSFNYKLADAEKDYFLAVVLKIIYESSLKDKIVFKGGTAIHHCYIPQSRFSEDLDFTSIDKSISLHEVKTVLESQDFLEVKKDYVSKATIKIERLKYDGPLGLPNSLKVEIDFIQNVVLPVKHLEYKNVWGIKTSVSVMDIKEICAEKIRAMSERALYRDFYDLCLIFKYFKIDLKDIIELIKQKEIRKPISKKNILENWRLSQKEKENKLGMIYYFEKIDDSYIDELLMGINIDLAGKK
ncbi:MAG: nucleotidyl transferase AbiEii/AbiGii toxin family protein [Candidatus Firestonebacteria bacterium]